MARLIIAAVFVIAVIVVALAALGVLKAATSFVRAEGEAQMPQSFQRIAFILLLILLFGLTSGWLGGV